MYVYGQIHALAPRSGWTRVLAGALTLILASPTALAAAPANDAQAEAEAMFRRGQAKYETADYAGAIELWTEAYALVGMIPDNSAIQALLIYNLAQAHIKAFELDEDAIHLKQAQQLLSSFEANLETVYGEDQAQIDTERAKIAEALADIEGRMAALEGEPEPEPGPSEGPSEPEPAPEPGPDSSATDKPVKSGKPLIITGGVLTGVGLGFGVLALVGAVQAGDANDLSELDPNDLVARDDQFALGRSANTLIAVGSIGAGVLVTTGVALIVVGALRNSKAKRAGASASRPMIAPSFGTASAGLTLTGRF